MYADLCAGPPETVYKPSGHVGRLHAAVPQVKKKKSGVNGRDCVEYRLERQGPCWNCCESKCCHGRGDYQQRLADRLSMIAVRAGLCSKEAVTLA